MVVIMSAGLPSVVMVVMVVMVVIMMSAVQVYLERRGRKAHVHHHGGLPSQAEGVSRLNQNLS